MSLYVKITVYLHRIMKRTNAHPNGLSKALCCVLLLLVAEIVNAQKSGLYGTDFWTGFIYHDAAHYTPPQRNVLKLCIIAQRDCEVIVSHAPQDGNVSVFYDSVTVHAVADSAVWVTLEPDELLLQNTAYLNLSNNSLHISSSDSILLFTYMSFIDADSTRDVIPKEMDMVAVWPTEKLGCEYYLNGYKNTNRSARLMAIAVEDSTEITVEGGEYAWLNGTRMLRKGQCLQTTDPELSGIHVYSPNFKPFVAIVGCDAGYIPEGYMTADGYASQMVPTQYWGTEFVATLTPNRLNDRVKVVSMADQTELRRDGTTVATLPRGGIYEFEIDTAHPTAWLQSSKPVSVNVYLTSSTYGNLDPRGPSQPGGYSGDPAVYALSPVSQWYSKTMFYSNANHYWWPLILGMPEFEYQVYNFIGVVTRTRNVDGMRLDGLSIADSFAVVASNPEYSYARIAVSGRTHVLENAEGPFEVHAITLGNCTATAVCGGWNAENIPVRIDDETIVCEGGTADLFHEGYEHIWTYGDGASGNEDTHVYRDAGVYSAECLYKRSQCQQFYDTAVVNVTVNPIARNEVYDTLSMTGVPSWMMDQYPIIEEFSDTLTSALGCDSIVTVHLYVTATDNEGGSEDPNPPVPPSPGQTYTLFLPDAFTPELYINNSFGAMGSNICYFEIMVFHRWGEMVWEGKGLDARWDGTHDGQLCPQGAYAYLIKFSVNHECERFYERKGVVMLLR